MTKAKERRVRTWLFGIASIFFFNPNVMLFDVLPDFIGWGLLLLTFSPAADILPHMDVACTNFKRLFWIGVARIPAFILMIDVYYSFQTERSIVPLLILCFGTLELIFTFTAVKELFEGIGYAASRAESDGIFYLCLSPKRINTLTQKAEKLKEKAKTAQSKGQSKKAKNLNRAADKAAYKAQRRIPLSALVRCACTLAIIKFLCEFLPELTQLTTFDSLGYVTPLSVNILNYRKYFVVLAALIALIYGIFYLVRFIGYSRVLSSSKALNTYLEKSLGKLREASPNLAIRRRVQLSALLFCVGFALMTDFYSDSLNVIPDTPGYIILFAAALTLLPLIKNKAGVVISGIVTTVLSALSWADTVSFTANHDYSAVAVRESAQSAFSRLFLLSAIEQLSALVFVFFICLALKELAKNYCTYKGDSINDYSKDSTPVAKVFARKLNISFALAVASSLTSLALLLSRTDAIRITNRLSDIIYIPRLSWMWMVQLGITLVWVIYTASTIFSLKNECDIANSD